MDLRYPDEPIPEIQVSLREFVQRASGILEDEDSIFDFCRMVLAGRVDVDGEEHRILVNARQDLEEIRPSRFTVTRDYDSICACTSDLPFGAALSIYPVAPFRDTLKVDNHLIGEAYDRHVSGKCKHLGSNSTYNDLKGAEDRGALAQDPQRCLR
jgi:hypothetical protein